MMKPKTTKTIYWVFAVLFAAFQLFDGFGGITKEPHGVQSITQLGYPVYVMQILGSAKILGVAGILQTKFNTLREWAYAGFAFNFIGAFASRAFAGDNLFLIVLPLLMFAFMLVPYFLGKRLESAKTQPKQHNNAALA
ncbi:MAG TPA: DoxX family protein [Chitinophagaceae bacterium]|nr:DoxX family protein [Chitinophagaceae bacterium]